MVSEFNNNQGDTINYQQEYVIDDGDSQPDQGEQVSVYMKDNVIMRRIEIEGDDREFLMDP